MSTMPTVPVFSPDGQLGDIPHDSLMHAIKAGGVPGVHVTDPDGSPGVIPANRLQDAIRAGAKMEPLADQPVQHEGFWSHLLQTGGQMLHMIPDLSVTPAYLGAPRSDVSRMPEQLAATDVQRQQEGHGLPYRVGATALGPIATGMEQAAREGDVKGVLGSATAGVGATLAQPALEGAGKVANRVIPSTTRAGVGLNMLTDSPEAAYANHPVETPTARVTARKIANELEVTGERPHEVIQHYLAGEELRNVPPEMADTLKAQGIDPSQPMSMYQARTMLKRVNDIIRNAKGFNADAPSKLATTNLKRFAGALDEDITNAANQGGFGQDYQAMRNEYARGKQIIRAGENIGPVVGGGIGAALGSNAGALATTEATGLGAVAGRYLGKPTIGAATRAVIERQGGAPRLRSMPPTPEAYTREVLGAAPDTKEALAAKYGLRNPGEADRRIVRAGGRVKVKPIPQPAGND